jgi:PAS domain S-box-containing protein
MKELCAALRAGAAVALIAEEALAENRMPELLDWTANQPSWSDLPFIILRDRRQVRIDGGKKLTFVQSAASITLLERPIHSETLVSAVKSALRARGRQYEVQATLAALADSEQRYRTLAEALPQLVWTSLPTGHIDFLSRQWVEYTGIAAEAQLGLGWISKVVHPDDRQSVLDGLLKAVRSREELDMELRLRRADGEFRSFQMRGTPIRDTRGNLVKWFGTCTDITDIVVAREVSARSRSDLEEVVALRTKSLAEANNRLTKEIADRERAEDALRQAQKLEAIGQLTSGVAHDFNNLLMAVMGNIDLAAKRVANDEAAVRSLRSAVRAVERGARLTAQLLAFSRKQRLAPKAVDINRLVSDASDMLFRTMGTSVRMESVLASELWPAMVDPNQIELVLLNLAINGRDAMADGGRLTIRTENVPESARPPDLTPQDYVMICVSDTGTGMTDDIRHRAFEPFFTTKDVGKGSGLGLSMVHGIAVQHGGNVYIDSAPGQGTAVRIYLPRADAVPAEAFVPEEGGTLLRGSATILVVDDDADVREVAVSGLQEFGYAVLEAENGHRALDILAEKPEVDLVLIDLAMPGMNGAETMRRARLRNPTLRAMFVTGYESTTAFEPGGNDMLLRKPYRLEALAEAVKQALLPPSRTNVVALKAGQRA